MSHFRVAVLQTPDSPEFHELMAPYDENLEVEPRIDVTRDEAIRIARERIGEAKARIETGESRSRDENMVAHEGDADEDLLRWFADDYCNQDTDEYGNLLTTYNPNSKWDYYGEIETLTFDEWLASGSEYSEEELRKEWKVLSTRGDGLFNKRYYLDRYGDEDTFVKACMLPDGWAVVTPDGEWCEPGQVGWWGMDSSEPETWRKWVDGFHGRFVEPYDRDATTVVIVDCHI